MALQTFTAGQVLTAAQVTALQDNSFNQTVSTKTASYTLVALDKGTRVAMNSASATTITVNTNLFAAGDTLFIQNIGAGVCTITAGTATVSTAGSLALAQNAGGTLYFTSTGVAIFFPNASSSAQGLTLINTTSFSGVASYSLPANTFNATYTNYRILITSLYASAGGINVIFRLRKSGTDNSDANSYRRTGFTSVSGSLTNSTGTDSSFYMTTLNGSSSAPAMMDTILYSPFVNNQTQINRITYRSDDEAMNMGVGRHTTADTFDSASFITSSGTMTGIISVYGFNI